MKIIHITGPESTGKTSLAYFLHNSLPNSILVEEFAREWLASRNRIDYSKDEVLEMFDGQKLLWEKALQSKKDFIIFDTDTVVYSIWFSYKYGINNDQIESSHVHFIPSITVLCAPDIPWESDPLRSNPNDREDLFVLYQKKLQSLNRSYIIAKGLNDQRNLSVLSQIKLNLAEDLSKENKPQ